MAKPPALPSLPKLVKCLLLPAKLAAIHVGKTLAVLAAAMVLEAAFAQAIEAALNWLGAWSPAIVVVATGVILSQKH
jgi:hypothetical protein